MKKKPKRKYFRKRIAIVGVILVILIILGIALKWHSELFILGGGVGAWLLIEGFFWIVFIIAELSTNSKLPSPNQIKEEK
jgi:hypothetical protein